MSGAVHFWFDLADPWSWLAMDDVRRVAQEAGRHLVWHPVRLPPAVSFTNPARAALERSDLARASAARGLPAPARIVAEEPLVEAMAAIHAVPAADRGPVAEAALRATWTTGDLPPELAASASGLDGARREAEAAGVFATPSVVVDDVVHWGADRMRFVRRSLGLPAARPSFPTAAPGATVRWFHDLASPFSYLASTQIERLEREAGVSVQRSPILLGALFRETGTPMVPLQTFSVAQQRWRLRDLLRWAEWWDVPFSFPNTFPLRTVTALRVALVEPLTTPAMYRAAWAEDRNIGDDAVLAEVLSEAGHDAPALLAATQDPAVKAQLRANTEAAVARGVCGVPTFDVNGTELVWGQDRLDHVVDLLARP